MSAIDPPQEAQPEPAILIAETIDPDLQQAAGQAARALESWITDAPDAALDAIRTVQSDPKAAPHPILARYLAGLLMTTDNGRYVYFSDEIYGRLEGDRAYIAAAGQVQSLSPKRQPEQLSHARRRVILAGLGAVALSKQPPDTTEPAPPAPRDAPEVA